MNYRDKEDIRISQTAAIFVASIIDSRYVKKLKNNRRCGYLFEHRDNNIFVARFWRTRIIQKTNR